MFVVPSFEEALQTAGTEREKKFFANPEAQAHFEPDELAYKKLKVIHRACNIDENGVLQKANYFTQNIKYYPWMRVKATEEKPAGFAFSNTGFGVASSFTSVGSRLCNNISEQRAMAIAEKHSDLYLIYWLEDQE